MMFDCFLIAIDLGGIALERPANLPPATDAPLFANNKGPNFNSINIRTLDVVKSF